MKNTTFLTAALVALGFSVNAQTTVTDSSKVVAKYSARNATVDSIASKYKLLPMPGELTLESKFPAVGTYQLSGSTDAASNVTVTLDSISKGTVWVSGLPQGTFKAYLAKSPATYRIVSQKSASGVAVPEGTLYFSPESNTLQVALGAPYNSENPAAIFPVAAVADATVATAPLTAEVKVKSSASKSKTKSKNKVTFYTASKVNTLNTTTSNAAFDDKLQQAGQQQ